MTNYDGHLRFPWPMMEAILDILDFYTTWWWPFRFLCSVMEAILDFYTQWWWPFRFLCPMMVAILDFNTKWWRSSEIFIQWWNNFQKGLFNSNKLQRRCDQDLSNQHTNLDKLIVLPVCFPSPFLFNVIHV
jgi:hypothetical protein